MLLNISSMFPNLLEDTKEYWCKLNELEAAYHEANTEVNSDWELTVADGLTDETW